MLPRPRIFRLTFRWEIESDFDGEIAEIYVENGQPVEYGQKLFRIR